MINAQDFTDAMLGAIRPDMFAMSPIHTHIFALACYRAAQRMNVVPPKMYEHVAADISAAFRNVAYGSQIPEVREGSGLLSTATAASDLRAACEKIWPKFFAAPQDQGGRWRGKVF